MHSDMYNGMYNDMHDDMYNNMHNDTHEYCESVDSRVHQLICTSNFMSHMVSVYMYTYLHCSTTFFDK